MAQTTRQTSLLVSQDWTKLYQTFRNADFQSYDFETLRASMISYLQLYYPEDFNDYIESSEFVALVDMIAFLGQSLAFRADLNARENFMDTAQRRDSILKLARLISYNPKRNNASKGFLKIQSVSTTETVYDSNGLDLSGLVINWADAGNSNWLEQFTIILNAAMVNNQSVGKPSNSQIINGIVNEEYQINIIANTLARFPIKATVAGTGMAFDIVSPTSVNKTYVYEVNPYPSAPFNILYKNDSLGNGSVNTGFFLYFVQGALQSQNFNFAESTPNRVYTVNVNNINNSDVWLYSVDSNGNLTTEWKQVPAVANTNVVYNRSTNKNVYQVNSLAGDQIELVFGDGSFANIPQGNFRLYYRTSNGLTYKITPDEMRTVVVPVSYVSQTGRVETINITASLEYTVANATAKESLNEIKQKAPQQYYTQNRMITGEDYNILPYTLFSDILKIKAVNRTSSGISRYLDVVDVTGKYSSTNIFAQDGILYRDSFVNTFSFDYNTTNDIYRVIYDRIAPIAQAPETKQFFYADYPLVALDNIYWRTSTIISNGCTGYFVDADGKIIQIGNTVSGSNKYIVQSSIVRLSAGSGNYFDANNYVKVGTPSKSGDKYYVYVAIELVVGDGTNGGQGNLANGSGPVTINQIIPVDQTVLGDKVFAVLNVTFSTALVSQMVSYVRAFANFGLRYDVQIGTWVVITPQDLNTTNAFSLTYAGNSSGQGLDSSWIVLFQTVGQTYTVSYRGLNYVFESVKETNFYYDGTTKIFDPATGLTVHDQIKVLKINNNPDNSYPLALDYTWYVYKSIVAIDGYVDTNKIYVTFSDSDNDGIPDNPELFDIIVNPTINVDSKFIYFVQTTGYDNFVVEEPVDNALVISTYPSLRAAQVAATLYTNGQLFYIVPENKFYKLSVTGSVYTLVLQDGTNTTGSYIAKPGRQDIYFQYRHNSPNNRRIDPSPNNIIDLYVMTQQYAIDYVAWAQDVTNTLTEPSAPTSEQLEINYSTLNNYKAISDTIIYNPAKFKPLFGSKAESTLQATFKVVKNANIVVSDNDIQASVISAINSYFDINNWDFGETFYFSELAAYLHVQLVPKISSIIIVPANQSSVFGGLMQVNANINEIITSCATVNDVKIISAITAAQINSTGTVITA